MTTENPKIILAEHTRTLATRPGLNEDVVLGVARFPEQRLAVRPGREMRRSRISVREDGTLYLVRVVVDSGQDGDTVVTVYRTSKIYK